VSFEIRSVVEFLSHRSRKTFPGSGEVVSPSGVQVIRNPLHVTNPLLFHVPDDVLRCIRGRESSPATRDSNAPVKNLLQ
jgi:hypothetical protein